MTLAPGTRLGSYEILSLLGAGGMGEVYRATDHKLGREVAIKVLAPAFARDPERLARFEREARVLASLNHPNIAAIYGFERADDVPFLVLEYVPGQTLAQLIAGGPQELGTSRQICLEVAEALEAAHEKGIVHRDLKPANIKITPDEKVKVLDFGLAKALGDESPHADPAQSPTLSLAPTRAGTILGTAAYMSPEQARGRPIDKRADIWAFGCVLYELLSGRRAFAGESISDILAAVLRAEPDWNALPPETPPQIRGLLRRCLEKDPHARIRDIGDARFELQDHAPTSIPHPPSRAVLWTACAVLAGAFAAGVAVWKLRPATSGEARTRSAVTLPAGQALETSMGNASAVALSPDGSRLVYLGRTGATVQLYLRPIDQFEAKPIAGTEDAYGPFFSPDGQWLGFFAAGKLKKVALAGGPATTLAEAPTPDGGSWGRDDTIVFAPDSWAQGLWRVPAAGGKAEPLTKPDPKKSESSHGLPQHLPNGEVILFTARSGPSTENAVIEALTLKTGVRRVLTKGGSNTCYLPTGHLVYARGGALLAAPFDPARLALTGQALPVLEGVLTNSFSGTAHFSVGADGTLVYLPSSALHAERSLVGVDRSGVAKLLTGARRAYEDMSLSPDGRRLALTIEGPAWNIWILEIARGTLTPLTLEHDNRDPLWTSDSKRVAYSSFRNGRYGLYWKPADGSGPEEQLTSSEYYQGPSSWSPDGQVLAYGEAPPETQFDIWLLPLGGAPGDRKPRPLVKTKFDENFAAFSPDGRWLAYTSIESAHEENYVQAYPGPGARVQVSTEGGRVPVWAASGRELYYRNGDKMMAVAIETKPTFKAASPRVLFQGRYWFAGRDYDVSPAGDRFYFIQEGPPPTEIRIIQNWFDDLNRRLASWRLGG